MGEFRNCYGIDNSIFFAMLNWKKIDQSLHHKNQFQRKNCRIVMLRRRFFEWYHEAFKLSFTRKFHALSNSIHYINNFTNTFINKIDYSDKSVHHNYFLHTPWKEHEIFLWKYIVLKPIMPLKILSYANAKFGKVPTGPENSTAFCILCLIGMYVKFPIG